MIGIVFFMTNQIFAYLQTLINLDILEREVPITEELIASAKQRGDVILM